MKLSQNHPFHLVNKSPWPILASFSLFSFMMGLIKWFHFYEANLLMFSMLANLTIMYQWWRDIVRESTYQGHHTSKVVLGLRWGMALFIISEIFFFLAFFWAFFHASLSPSIELGMNWPPKGIEPFDPMQIPLLNTLILLTSGLTVTWTHYSVLDNNYYQSLKGLLFTVLLGFSFSVLQIFEYLEAPFTIADSVYGSTFFMTTGLHGLHVIIGSIFLFVCLIRLYLNHFTSIHHFGLEAAAWYWHFVDVVWLFLYVSIYWWGS